MYVHLIPFPAIQIYSSSIIAPVFEEFATNVESYLKSFTEVAFLNSVTSVTNSDNPFAFNETSNTVYMQRHILVFRRKRLMRELYIKYCRMGLLDPGHTIGISSAMMLSWLIYVSFMFQETVTHLTKPVPWLTSLVATNNTNGSIKYISTLGNFVHIVLSVPNAPQLGV